MIFLCSNHYNSIINNKGVIHIFKCPVKHTIILTYSSQSAIEHNLLPKEQIDYLDIDLQETIVKVTLAFDTNTYRICCYYNNELVPGNIFSKEGNIRNSIFDWERWRNYLNFATHIEEFYEHSYVTICKNIENKSFPMVDLSSKKTRYRMAIIYPYHIARQLNILPETQFAEDSRKSEDNNTSHINVTLILNFDDTQAHIVSYEIITKVANIETHHTSGSSERRIFDYNTLLSFESFASQKIITYCTESSNISIDYTYKLGLLFTE